jgi:hypothetical protein
MKYSTIEGIIRQNGNNPIKKKVKRNGDDGGN